jgi:hypothetical protein
VVVVKYVKVTVSLLFFFVAEGIWRGLGELLGLEPMHVTPELTGFRGLLLLKEHFSI